MVNLDITVCVKYTEICSYRQISL